VTGENVLLAATSNGIFSFDPERDAWDDTSTGLTSLDITTFAAQPAVSITETTDQPASLMVLAGSREGRLFVSIDSGLTWQPLGLDLRGTDITALEVDETSGDIWVGTAAGAVLVRRLVNRKLTWQSVQEGRSPLATKLQILSQLQPSFTSTRYGEPGYMQLRQNCPEAIRAGGEDGAEMGVFYALKQPQREANLLASLDEYLRFGLAAGIFYMT
jgi:hypothetical protein